MPRRRRRCERRGYRDRVDDFLGPGARSERVRPEERRRYQFGLGFNLVAGIIWLVMYIATGAWYFAVLLAVCAVIAGMAGWALMTLRSGSGR
jgi:fatty acid desaturase